MFIINLKLNDFNKIFRNKGKIKKALHSVKQSGKSKDYKHCGKIKLTAETLKIQKVIKDE